VHLTIRIATIALALAACAEDRDRPETFAAHPEGWADPQSPSFHAAALAQVFAQPHDGNPLTECQGCHGADYGGGNVGVACTSSGCHTQPGGPEFCGTCHGDPSGPLPADNGQHTVHQAFCADCHQVPQKFDTPGHANGTIDVIFSSLPTVGNYDPQWDPGARRCNNVYCHQGDSPVWDDDTPLGCSGCHDTEAIHGRFIRVVNPDTCAGCHQGSPAVGHLDGHFTLAIDGCIACHGSAGSPAPPVGLDGATASSDPRVGAHRRHLDPTLSDRMGKVVACTTCHTVPQTVLAGGHIDATAPADVDVDIGTYDPATRSCRAWCHVNGNPVWNDDSGAARQCDSCHGFPPTTTTWGGPHPTVEPSIDACRECHTFTPYTHVDGEVTFK
jgi:predicted CxxxxCH...CXXCH cytochrome family protein